MSVMQAKPERGSLPASEPGRRRAPHYARTRLAFRTAAALCRFEPRPALPSNPAKHPSNLGPWTLDLGLFYGTVLTVYTMTTALILRLESHEAE